MVYMIFSNSASSLEGVKNQDLKSLSILFYFQHLPHLDQHAKLGSVTIRLFLSPLPRSTCFSTIILASSLYP